MDGTGGTGGADEPRRVGLWERLERPLRAPRATLSHERIARAAVELADAEGLDAVSMRRLAGGLGVAAMALYRYVDDKEELLRLMVDAVYGEIAASVTDEPGWRRMLAGHAHRSREVMLRHPWLAQLTSGHLTVLTPSALAVTDRLLAGLDERGLDADRMMAAVGAVNAYVHGAVAAEIARERMLRHAGWENADEMREALAPEMTWLLGTGRYPAFARYLRRARDKDDFARQFAFGLDCVLDGIAARISP
jgi:AcrR family transcriptional regulator